MKISAGIDFIHLVLKKHGKWFLKMCGDPDKIRSHQTAENVQNLNPYSSLVIFFLGCHGYKCPPTAVYDIARQELHNYHAI